MPTLRFMALMLACVSLLSPKLASGRNVSWGSDPNSDLFDSTGASALDASFTFEIGSFGAFVPTIHNMSDWQTNWKVFDRAVEGNGWTSGAQWFAGVANLEPDGTSESSPPLPAFTFALNEQAYLWVYDSLLFETTSEWALITNDSSDGNALDNWRFPDPADTLSATPVYFDLFDATVSILGGVNDVQGPGTFSGIPVGSFDLQTSVVPEPGTALLIGVAGVLFRLRRRLGR